MTAPLLEKTFFSIQTLSDKSLNTAVNRRTTYENLPPIMDPTSPLINAYTITITVSLSPRFIISTKQPYVNFSNFKYSSNTNSCNSYSNTFVLTPLNFVILSSNQIASYMIHIFVQAWLHT